jgi:hypothetical protein
MGRTFQTNKKSLPFLEGFDYGLVSVSQKVSDVKPVISARQAHTGVRRGSVESIQSAPLGVKELVIFQSEKSQERGARLPGKIGAKRKTTAAMSGV